MSRKKVAIVGGGPGGLTAGMILAHRGFDVTVYERRDEVGGRSGRVRVGPYTFDAGSTILMMKFVLDEMFALVGRRADDELTFAKLDPMYQLLFEDCAFTVSSDHPRTEAEIARLFPGNEAGLARMLERERRRLRALYACLQRTYPSLLSMANADIFRAAFHFAFGQSMFDVVGHYFTDDRLKLAFSFQSEYLGMSPWTCPGGFAIVPFVEHEFGIYHVMGGINRIAFAMQRVLEEEGGRVVTEAPVKRLLLEGREVVGLELEGGERELADEVIVGADFAWSMRHLVDDGVLRKYSAPRLERKRFSCSAFMLYLGLDRRYDHPHHSFVFARDCRKNMDDIYHAAELSDDVSIYLCNPSVTDPSLAPEGHSALYVLVPVPNLQSGVDWETSRGPFRDRVLQIIASRTPLTDVAEHIREEVVVTPADWARELNVHHGAVFNLAHLLGQLLWFRPHNEFEELRRCYLVGGGTNPGSGMPTIYESGRIASDLICRKHGVAIEPAWPLP